jgi:hypothetical protein
MSTEFSLVISKVMFGKFDCVLLVQFVAPAKAAGFEVQHRCSRARLAVYDCGRAKLQGKFL